MTFRIEKADAGLYQEIEDIIESVWEQIENKDWFVADNAEYTYRVLNEGNGAAYVAVEEESGRKAGVFLTVFPGNSEHNLGRDAGLSKEELEYVAHMESVAVLPEFRGHQLQYRLMQEGERELRKRGYRYLMCTVHPDNVFSLNNVRKQGYEIVKVGEKYGGYRRAVLLKRLAKLVSKFLNASSRYCCKSTGIFSSALSKKEMTVSNASCCSLVRIGSLRYSPKCKRVYSRS